VFCRLCGAIADPWRMIAPPLRSSAKSTAGSFMQRFSCATRDSVSGQVMYNEGFKMSPHREAVLDLLWFVRSIPVGGIAVGLV
jgi:hypothetical protein